MKIALFLLRFVVLVIMWMVLYTVASFTLAMWQTWVLIVCIALYSSLTTFRDRFS